MLVVIIVMLIIVTVIVVVSIIKAEIYNKRKRRQEYNYNQNTIGYTPPYVPDHKDYTRCYQRKYLLTRNEYQAYKNLRIILEKHGLIACPKVRLLDIIEPIRGEHYKGALGKIQSKHIDFLICDKDLYIKGILELDDNSHNQPERIERDRFVDQVLTTVGYKVVRVRAVTEDTIRELL